MSIIKAK